MSEPIVKFVTPTYNGKLGNNMFQIAAAYGYAKANNANILLPEWEYKDVFNIKEEYFKYYNPIISNNNIIDYNEPLFKYNKIPNFNNTIVRLNGYFQSYKYFDNIKNDIQHIFSFNEEIKNKINEKYKNIFKNISDVYVSIHVRVGDYQYFPLHHPILSENYYINAVKYLKTLFGTLNINILWFSDTMNYVKNMINTTELRNMVDNKTTYYFIEDNKNYEDMYLQSRTDAIIIANSSFSYWSAYLNNHYNNKIVLVPDHNKWFGPALKHHDTSDLYPPHWTEIKY